jgi:uncharacterized integral membrane protein
MSTITKDTKVPLGLVITVAGSLLTIAVSGTVGWMTLRGEIKELRHEMD